MSDFSIRTKIEDAGYNLASISDGMTELFRDAVDGIARRAHTEWVRIAQERLGTSRETYVNGLQQAASFKVRDEGSSRVYELSLVGAMPNNFEFGMPSFDMKTVRPGWLGGGRAKTAKDGHKYVVIPFRHSKSSSPQMAYTGKAKAENDPEKGDLKKQLRKAVKDYGLDRMIRSGTGQVKEGPVKRIPKKAPVHPYLAGLTRVQKPVGGGTKGTSQLMTWRVMSEKSPASSWIHPGVRAANILPEVEAFVDRELDRVIDMILGT